MSNEKPVKKISREAVVKNGIVILSTSAGAMGGGTLGAGTGAGIGFLLGGPPGAAVGWLIGLAIGTPAGGFTANKFAKNLMDKS